MSAPPSEPEAGLPRALFWLYPALLGAAGVGAIERAARLGLRDALGPELVELVPWLALGLLFFVLYRGVAQRVTRGARLWWLAHALFVAAVAAAGGAALAGLLAALGRPPEHLGGFVGQCVVMSWLVVLPSYAFERARAREREMARRLEQARRAALDAQLRALQAQLNPHFLFNALNVVSSLVHEDPDRAERTVERLASLLRYSLEGARVPDVALAREVAFVTDYLEMQRTRFGARLDAAVEVDRDALSVRVPPLVLQPLVENAVMHGLGARRRGVVRVRVARDGAKVRLTVHDDGPGPGASAHHGSGTSLDNLRQRLEAWPGASLELRSGKAGGCEAALMLPAGAPPP